MKTFTRTILTSIIAAVGIPAAYILAKSRGKTRRHRDENGNVIPDSVAEITYLDINNSSQGMIIRGSNDKNPVLLYLHGGPGAPEYPFARQMNRGLEEIFMVCYWEQRGSGLSFSKEISPHTMNVQSFIDDALKITEYLKNRFNQEQIYLLGHSWGSYLGALLARDYPHNYKVFISTGQITNQTKSELITYNHILSVAKDRNDKKVVRKLLEMGPPPWWAGEDGVKKITTQRKYVTKYGGTMKDKKKLLRALSGVLLCNEYKLSDKINYPRGILFTITSLLDDIMRADLFREVPSLRVPVYILQGTSDYQTVYSLAREYYEMLDAPEKEFFTFNNSAHAAIFEEPEKFNAVMRMIISEHEKQKMTEMFRSSLNI